MHETSTGANTNLVDIEGTDWQLSLAEPSTGLRSSFIFLTLFNIVALVLTVAIIGFLIRYIMRSMETDFEQVKSLLT